MSRIPAWTARQWRPPARDLVARFPSATDDDASGLRVNAVLAQLYGHRWLEVMPQDVAEEVAAVATKMRIHALEERGDRVETLAPQCDFRVVKLLLALAENPTRLHVAAEKEEDDREGRRRVEERLKRRRTGERSGEQSPARAENNTAQVLAMEKELLQIAWQDDWWAESSMDERDDDGDEDDDDLMLSDVEKDDGDESGGIAVQVLGEAALWNEEKEEEKKGTALPSIDVEMEDVAYPKEKEEEGGAVTDSADEDGEEEERALLLRWYAATPADVAAESEPTQTQTQTPLPTPTPDAEGFSLETPSTLIDAMASLASVDRRVVHERTLVAAALHALRGVPTPFFEFRSTADALFASELTSVNVTVASLVTRHLAVSHVSPLAVSRAMAQLARMASDLAFLQSLASFLTDSTARDHESTRSSVAEGLAMELRRVVLDAQRFVTELECSMATAPSTWAERDDERLSSRAVCGTLLGALTALRTPMARVSWLRRSMEQCFARFVNRPRAHIPPSELSAAVLSELFRQLQQLSIEKSTVKDSTTASFRVLQDPFEILLHMFTSALVPYLEALDVTVFRRSHAERIPMHRELFFVEDPAAAGIASPLRSPWKSRNEASFEDAVSTVLPFRVQSSAVPTFLAPLVEKLRHALVSRQMWNRFLSTSNQRGNHHEDSRLATDCINALLGNETTASQAMMPFARVVEKSVLVRIENQVRRKVSVP
ncbi:hypothetical protein PINS_up009142 [Pythium insidiosum]|nr:hypothetical protein PINS_up009142 [Pythium insidiosum]